MRLVKVVIVHENDWIPFDTSRNVAVVVDQENLTAEEEMVGYYRITVVAVGNFPGYYHELKNED